jgi:putative ABC transport system permease protein
MPTLSGLDALPRVLAALVLVIVAAGIAWWQKVDLEREIGIATVRAFVQLIAIGYLLEAVFGTTNPLFIVLILVVMTTIAGYTAGQRGAGVPNARIVAWVAIAAGTLTTLGLLVALRVFRFEARLIIPIGGMVIGNSMTTCGLVLARLREEIKNTRMQIEAALALGATPRQSVAAQLRRVLKSGLLPVIDSTKIVGIIQLPGTMTGMILGGASPLAAVQTQVIVLYMLLGAAAFSALATALFGYRGFFSAAYQVQNIPQ